MKKICYTLMVLVSLKSTAQNALNFDGTNDYVQTPQAGPTGNASRTIEAWVKLTTLVTTQGVIVDWGDMSIGHRCTFNIINGIPRIEAGGNGINATSAISLNVWHHLAATYNSATNMFNLYIDGVFNNSGTLTVTVNTSNVNGIQIGRRNDSINYFNGTIDEVRVWSTARSQSQIMAAKSKEFCSPTAGLVAYYKFNEGIAGGNNSGLITLTDLSGNNNYGVLHGFSLSGASSNWVTGNSFAVNTTSTISVNSCGSYISPSGNVYTASGTFHDTIPNAIGCDSVIVINLTLNPIDTSVNVTSSSMIAQQTGAMYQWVNCATNYSFIAGQTTNTFSPTISGNYAVIITNGSCTDTSTCINFTALGIHENYSSDGLQMFPNPAANFSTISAPLFVNSLVTIFDIMGKVVLSQPFNKTETLNLSLLNNGVYIIEIKNKVGNAAVSKLIKM